MLRAHLLGTSGMQPLYKRGLASALIVTERCSILIDAGEGTQIALHRYGNLIKKIGYVLITHLHLDHIGGIPGILQSIANTGRRSPVTFVGPIGLKSKINASMEFISCLPYDIKIKEIDQRKIEYLKFDNIEIQPFLCKHSVTCFGYNIVENRNRKFLIDKVMAAGVAKEDYGKILEGRPIFVKGKKLNPNEFLGPKRKGLKITYCTDTRPNSAIETAAMDADLFICEGMYSNEQFLNKAEKYKHMLATEAARIANKSKVKELWLTHFSPVVVHPEVELKCAHAIFDNTKIGYSGLCVELNFDKKDYPKLS